MSDNEIIGIQRYRVYVEFDHEAEVYEDDPTDVFALAALEQQAFEDSSTLLVDAIYSADTNVHITVMPAGIVE